MPEKIRATQHDLLHVFCDEYSFRVPDYQRPYAWTEKQTGELLDDIFSALDAGGERSEDRSPYFLGSIVLIKGDKPDSDVVDGQQRLTTLTILLSVLRELSSNPRSTDDIDEYICKRANTFAEMTGGYRLTLRERDREFFQENIQIRDGIGNFLKRGNRTDFSDSQTRLFQNTQLIWKALEAEPEDRRNSLMRFLLHNTYLVVVTASDLDSAYKMFSVMNARGLDLSPTDILKAEIIGKVTGSNQPDYTDKWEEIEEELGRDAFGKLFSHIRMIYAKEKSRRSLIVEFRDQVLKSCSGTEFIDDVLMPYYECYSSVVDEKYKGVASETPAINSLLKYLNRVNDTEWIAPAMAYLRRHSGDGESVLKFVKDLDRLVYSLQFRGVRSDTRIPRYAAVVAAIEENANLFESGGALQLTCEEKKQFREAIDGPVGLRSEKAKYLLLRLNDLRSEGIIYDDRKTVTLEHVLPQNPRSESQWIEWFRDWDERHYWTNKLANLVLLSRRKNTQAGNYEFDEKKRKYFRSDKMVTTFALTVQVLEEDVWTPEVLERRQKDLCETLIKEWRL